MNRNPTDSDEHASPNKFSAVVTLHIRQFPAHHAMRPSPSYRGEIKLFIMESELPSRAAGLGAGRVTVAGVSPIGLPYIEVGVAAMLSLGHD
jgi:hypothetical protein